MTNTSQYGQHRSQSVLLIDMQNPTQATMAVKPVTQKLKAPIHLPSTLTQY
jgi:hypothetical protein